MKKLTLAASLVLGFGLVANANAVDGSVTFNGKIVDQTCTVATNKKDQTVTLPTVQSSSLATASSTAGETPFTISLTNCKTKANSGISKVKAFFLPNATNVDENTHNLINIEKTSPAATNVQVQLLNKDLTAINVGENITDQSVNGTEINDTNKTDGTVTAELKYFARYYATNPVTAGKVTSKVEYNIVYE